MFDTAQKPGLVIAVCIVCACTVIPACGQDAAVTMRMAVRSPAMAKQEKSARAAVDASDIVVWLKPLDPVTRSEPEGTANPKKFRLVQHNKSFQPHVLVVPVVRWWISRITTHFFTMCFRCSTGSGLTLAFMKRERPTLCGLTGSV